MVDLNHASVEWGESAYLLQNSDVAAAVEANKFESGWSHFISHGFREPRAGVSPDIYAFVQRHVDYRHRQIIAPEPLRRRVHGASDLASFDSVGRIVAQNVFGELMRCPIHSDEFSILDFGVGCGRVIRNLYDLCANTRLTEKTIRWYGTDIDQEAIHWDKCFLNQLGEFAVNEPIPPLDFKDNQLDFIYAISVFTHLPEDMQFLWLGELSRVIKPTGTVLLTTHGVDLEYSPDDKSTEDGFTYFEGAKTHGLPDFYRTTFHGHEYILRNWEKYFNIKKIIRKGIANHQDLIVCHPKST